MAFVLAFVARDPSEPGAGPVCSMCARAVQLVAMLPVLGPLEDVTARHQATLAAIVPIQKRELEKKKREHVCLTCDDTHLMTLGEEGREVMCTFCPRPCQHCRAGGIGVFCDITPCPCACHPHPSSTPELAPWIGLCEGCSERILAGFHSAKAKVTRGDVVGDAEFHRG